MRVVLALLAAFLLVTLSVRAQASYEDVYPDAYEGVDLDLDDRNHLADIPAASLGLEAPYPEAPQADGASSDDASDPDDGEAGSGPGRVNIISAPPLGELCPPTDSPSKAAVKNVKKQRIKVLFVVILPSVANETVPLAFDEAQLVSAFQKASRARGAQHDFEVKVSKVEYIPVSMRKSFRRRSLLQSSTGFNIKVSGEADFAGEDEMVASEMVQLLTDAPTTIFPEDEFGTIQVPEATMTEMSNTSWVLPLGGVLGGLASVAAFLSLYMYWGGNVVPKKQTPDLPYDEGFIPGDDKKLRAMANVSSMSTMSNVTQHSLLSSISSRNYSDKAAPPTAGEKQWNNLGYYQQ